MNTCITNIGSINRFTLKFLWYMMKIISNMYMAFVFRTRPPRRTDPRPQKSPGLPSQSLTSLRNRGHTGHWTTSVW